MREGYGRGVRHWPVWRTIFRNTRIPSIRPWIPVFCQGFPYSGWIPVFRMDSCIFQMDSRIPDGFPYSLWIPYSVYEFFRFIWILWAELGGGAIKEAENF